MPAAELPPSAQLRRLIAGYQVSQAIHVAATLGIADLLADGPRASHDLAGATETDADSLYRLLRALASIGVLHEGAGRHFTLTPVGEPLRSDAPDSLAGWAAFVGRPYYWSAWSSLLHSVRTGENAFRTVHGTDVWKYRSEHPDESTIFDGAMMSLTRGSNRSVLDAYDFGRFGTVVDVAGGTGALLAAVLAEYPEMQGILFDQPHVVAAAGDVLGEFGDRCRVVGGSFFEAVPDGGDAYVLKAIIHDWEDAEAAAILRVCRDAMTAGRTLLVVERDVGLPNEAPEAKFSDLNMLVAPGGRERTLDEYGSLFSATGFRLTVATPTASGLTVIEAVAA
jgi:hypothetical protein